MNCCCEKQLASMQKTLNKYGKYIEQLDIQVGILNTDSHKPMQGLEERLQKLETKEK